MGSPRAIGQSTSVPSRKPEYAGPIQVRHLVAEVDLRDDLADVAVQYLLENPSSRQATATFSAAERGLARIQAREQDVPRSIHRTTSSKERTQIGAQQARIRLSPLERKVLDVDFVSALNARSDESFMFVPVLLADSSPMATRIPTMNITFRLPDRARKMISSSVPPSSVHRVGGRLVAQFRQDNAYAMPITVRWTESQADVEIRKTVRETRGGLVISIKVKNQGNEKLSRLKVEDVYPEGAIEEREWSGRAGGAEVVRAQEVPGSEARLAFSSTVAIEPGQTIQLTYKVKSRVDLLSIPPTICTLADHIVAIARVASYFASPAPFPLPRTALAIPSGWSFDYLHGGDHHLNEHGLETHSLQYNQKKDQLFWATSCMFADKNFDDDYRWWVDHQVLRFAPGFSYVGSTAWLDKKGAVTTHSGSFSNPTLCSFQNAIVLPMGWSFDFTSGDHHINRVMFNVEQGKFDRKSGSVTWKTSATFADKNWDDDYRFRYRYVVLGFNGQSRTLKYQGTDKGGTAAHAASETLPVLKGYKSGMVIPTGWAFDFASSDKHVNEHYFDVEAASYRSSDGRFTWNTRLNYSDKNFDDPYSWGYSVALLATNDGEVREYQSGPHLDDGGFAMRTHIVDLGALMVPITWTNGVRDGDETGVDCGGSSPAVDLQPMGTPAVNPGKAASSKYFCLRDPGELMVLQVFATAARVEYALHRNVNFTTFYSGIEEADRTVEAVAWYVDQHMSWVKDSYGWQGPQRAIRTLTESVGRGPGDFNGDCEDFAILRAALLRSLGFRHEAIFCADHSNSVNQGQYDECDFGKKKSSGGHVFNIVVYRGKYRIMDYGPMQSRYWSNKRCWDQHVVDNVWNDHTGKYDTGDTSPYGGGHLVNDPGNLSTPGGIWDWRTLFNDVTP